MYPGNCLGWICRHPVEAGCDGSYEMCWWWCQARLDILKIHSRKMNLTRGINLRKIAEMMPGASGAEVKVSVAGGHTDRLLTFLLPDHLPCAGSGV